MKKLGTAVESKKRIHSIKSLKLTHPQPIDMMPPEANDVFYLRGLLS